MNCPKCGEKSKVSEAIKENNTVYRLKKCLVCGLRFYTKVVSSEAECGRDEFLISRRKKEREAYRKKCMKVWQVKRV